jgi:hypothetical protein
MSGIEERNKQLWDDVILRRLSFERAGRRYGISSSRARYLVVRSIYRNGYQLELKDSETIRQLRIALRVIA